MLQVLLLGSEEQKKQFIFLNNLQDGSKCQLIEWECIDEKYDLVIINSHLEFTVGWLENLIQCANSYSNVGTVSPMLRQDFMSESESEKYNDVTIADWGRILRASSDNNYSSVEWNLFDGIYIKSEVLCDVGTPSQEIVEDMDKAKNWFLLVEQLGWKNNISNSCMVAGKLLYGNSNRYYKDRLTKNVKETTRKLWESIELYFKLHFENNRLNILHYLLADFQEGMANNIGGTQFHVSDLVSYQKKKYNVFVLARDGEYLRLTEYVDDDKIQFDFFVGAVEKNNIFYDKIHEDLYRKVLKVFDINLLHVHHTMWMPLNIYYVAKDYQIPIFLSVHDYYYVCPVLKMINLNDNLCTKKSCENDCKDCLKERKNIMDGSLYSNKWHNEHERVIKLCEKVIFPSQQALDVMMEFYPFVSDKAIVIEHGICLPKERCIEKYNHEKMRVAFIGGISDIKGGDVIYNLIQKDKSKFDWYLMGGIGYSDLIYFEQNNLKKTGWYKQNEIYSLLREEEIDIICILSIVAETFCYTLSEAVAMGIPVIVKDVGALGERTRNMKCGWVIPRESNAEYIYSLLCKIENDKRDYNRYKENLKAFSGKSIEDMGQDYDVIYDIKYSERQISNLYMMLEYLHDSKETKKDEKSFIKSIIFVLYKMKSLCNDRIRKLKFMLQKY